MQFALTFFTPVTKQATRVGSSDDDESVDLDVHARVGELTSVGSRKLRAESQSY
jgi:hypothetical protein